MNIIPHIVIGQHGDEFPDSPAEVILYFRTNGDSFIRWFGAWKRMYRRSNAVTGMTDSLSVNLTGGVWTKITYPGTHDVKPNFRILCYKASDINTVVNSYELRYVNNVSFEINVSEDCVMELDIMRRSNVATSQYVEHSV